MGSPARQKGLGLSFFAPILSGFVGLSGFDVFGKNGKNGKIFGKWVCTSAKIKKFAKNVLTKNG